MMWCAAADVASSVSRVTRAVMADLFTLVVNAVEFGGCGRVGALVEGE